MGVANAVIDNIETDALVDAINGGGDAIFRGSLGSGAVTAEGTPSLRVYVATMRGFIGHRRFKMASATYTANVIAPTGGSAGDLRRIDLVQYTWATGVNIVTGTEDAAPVVPATSASSIALAHLYLRKGMANIKDTDDTTNGYIVDAREFR